MKKLIWFTTITILFLVFIAPAFLALGIKMIPGENQPGYDPAQRLSIYQTRNVTQQFTSQDANLSAIGTSIRNPNLKNKKDIILTLFNENMEIIRTTTINGQNVEDGNFIKFVFEIVPNSENKTYFISLSSPDAGPEEMIEVFYSHNMPGWIEQYTYDQEVQPGGLPIVLYFKPVSKFAVIKDIYSNWFSRLLHLNSQKTS
ncbi:MAG: hypothetical protein UV71_C0011G0009 [Microgenomates group bacterium GW2011_GWC1_43_13]|uniref:Uncharacterized protein n=1 Tax=Candidatus Vogelbacteria bacterium RIFOXYD1_FULL_42_15 TaxID=1802437 RepID=A0A1G2QJ27_9BACT|nr:MAG: hypothetical protein UV71_C0011G0009 [Microgenomates group bacterium GW2011_GWC1_43_13]OGM76646.1 MAG: hypothetical protein A2208_00255 [Candidatus Woesebacteria bacterium RIFOXYA1_FULL_43_16]OHA60654.1 MAG: hypothetical protein A2607_01895 [Candidatus Vogelbacteria bacterium RIFOXYD1_FULL_42_15]